MMNAPSIRDRTFTVAVLLAVFAGVAYAADEPAPLDIGRSILVVNDVDGQLGEQPPKRLVINDDIAFNEDITTSSDAKTVIEFRDGSVFEVGPDAVIRIDAFVFNPEESTSHKTLQVTRGVFRYVSGYAAADQDTQIQTRSGVMGIRGSVASGVVDPDLPDFVFLEEGSARFATDAGASDLQAGQAVAVPSRMTAPMRPDHMPPAVAAQAIQVIQTRLPPQDVVRSRPPADEAQLRRFGAANLVSATEQRRLQEAAAGPQAMRPAPSLAASFGLLREAATLHLFERSTAPATLEQRAFLTHAAQAVPNARMVINRSVAGARQLHAAARLSGTAAVMRGVTLAAPSAAVVKRVATAAVRANPAAAETIKRAIAAAPDRRAAARSPSEPKHPREETARNDRPGKEHPAKILRGANRNPAKPTSGKPPPRPPERGTSPKRPEKDRDRRNN